ncbi:MAG: transposase [Clostridia bacterium]|jgi:transposase|nr:transposase [Clostridia bacterium]
MRRSKVNWVDKVEAVEKYKRGEGSIESLSLECGVNTASFHQWISIYDAMGPSGLADQQTNKKYSAELKIAAVEAYLRGGASQAEICKRYGIRSRTQLQDWIKHYNDHKEFRTRRKILMTKGRSTTLDERIEIVSYCLANGKDYGATIEKYGVSYQQMYSWVRKYEEKGLDGLIDKRGKRKPVEEMNEIERLKLENKMLRAENKQKEMEIAVLKKLQEIERRRD